MEALYYIVLSYNLLGVYICYNIFIKSVHCTKNRVFSCVGMLEFIVIFISHASRCHLLNNM